MKQARRITVTESVVYEVGQTIEGQQVVDHINISYPLARVYVKDDAVAVVEVFLQASSVIEWLED